MAQLILSLPNDRAGFIAAESLRADARERGNFEYLGDLASSIAPSEGDQLVFAGGVAPQREPSRAAEWLRRLPITFHLISTPGDEPGSLIRDLFGIHSRPEADGGERGFIFGIEEVPEVTLCTPPNGVPTLHSNHQMFMNQLRVPNAHANLNLGAVGTIALIDTGCDGVAIDDYYDLLNSSTYHPGTGNAKDTVGHGTGMAMIMREVAPHAALTVVRISDTVNIPLWNVLAGVAVAVLDAEAEIINLSLGTSNLTGICGHCGTSAAARGIAFQYLLRCLRNQVLHRCGHPPTFVAATGNSGYGTGFSAPARYDECLAVGSVNSYAQRSTFSTYGTPTHQHYIVAPGGEKLGKTATEYAATDSVEKYCGTSIAAAYTSGILALFRTDDPHADLMQLATQKVVPASPKSICGWGQIVYS
jgi:hypothetical protein